MHLLYHWRRENYQADMASGSDEDFHLIQNSERMLEAQPGDSLWAFTRRDDKRYVLAAHLVVQRVERVNDSDYGEFMVTGNPRKSRFFDVRRGDDVEPVIRGLSIQCNAQVLGCSFQGPAAVRVLTEADHRTLANFAAGAPTR